jgi:ABC-type multidrug transport system ATPase subunit
MLTALEVTNLVKCYGKRRALDGLTLRIPRYSVTGLVGSNGAGKTTFMMTVAGFLKASSGTINLLGNGPFDAELHGGRFSILPQDSELPLTSSPLELLTHYGRLQGLSLPAAKKSATEMLETVNLGDRATSTIRSLSHGMRKRVMAAQCFLGQPELILLDEPLNGLDPREAARMRDFLSQRTREQTIVISSHNLNDIEQLCDHVAFIEKGKSVRFGPVETITRKASIMVYQLSRPPANLAQLEALLGEGGTLHYQSQTNSLTCHAFDATLSAEELNRRLVPFLLTHCGLLTINQGHSLEEAYLKQTEPPANVSGK